MALLQQHIKTLAIWEAIRLASRRRIQTDARACAYRHPGNDATGGVRASVTQLLQILDAWHIPASHSIPHCPALTSSSHVVSASHNPNPDRILIPEYKCCSIYIIPI